MGGGLTLTFHEWKVITTMRGVEFSLRPPSSMGWEARRVRPPSGNPEGVRVH